MADLQASEMDLVSGGDIDPDDPEKVKRELRRHETVKGNPLSIDIIYMQRFILLQENKEEEFVAKLLGKDGYAHRMLNDEKFGIVFFKARVFSNKRVKHRIGDSRPEVEYILHFHAFAEEYLTDEKVHMIKVEFLPPLLTSSDGEPLAELLSTELNIHEDTKTRKPVYDPPPNYTDDETPRQIGGLEANTCWHKFINFWLIVPRVQTDFFNLIYQMYTFDITHQGFYPKFVHFFTIPTNLILFFMFFAQFKLPGSYIEDTTVRRGPFFFPTNWSYLPLGILLLLYIIMGFVRKCPIWGCATAVVITMLWGVGNLFYNEVRLPKDANATGVYDEHWLNPVYLPYNPILLSYIVSIIQALSHMLVPEMPPYITGVTHWESIHVYLWRYNGRRQCCYKILAVCLFPILSVAVAYFSWPHLIGTQVFYIMAGIGYEHNYFKKYKLITEKAELSGNPRLAYFPSSADVLMNPQNPYIHHLKAHGIVHEEHQLDEGHVAKEVASHHIYNCYFRGRHFATDPNERDSHIYHYKAVGDHYYSRQK